MEFVHTLCAFARTKLLGDTLNIPNIPLDGRVHENIAHTSRSGFAALSGFVACCSQKENLHLLGQTWGSKSHPKRNADDLSQATSLAHQPTLVHRCTSWNSESLNFSNFCLLSVLIQIQRLLMQYLINDKKFKVCYVPWLLPNQNVKKKLKKWYEITSVTSGTCTQKLNVCYNALNIFL